jgi:hypothetical protein
MVVSGSDTTYVENNTPISGIDYRDVIFGIEEASMVDATFVKLRELTLSYDVPASLAERLRLSGIQVSLIGRNLWLWTPDSNQHIDPETSTEASNVQGFEYGQMPSARSFGFTFSVRP